METSKNSKNDTGEFTFSLQETDDNLFFEYRVSEIPFTLIYSKEKDICMILKEGRACELKKLTETETERYKEVLDIAICYHHDREVEHLN